MARSPKSPVTLPSNEVKPAITEPGAVREVSFSPVALQAVIAQATKAAVELATAALRAEMQQALGAKPPKAAKASPAPAPSSEVKTERSIQNEIAVVKAFKKAGYSNVVPHQNVKTFNRWMAEGRRPIEGSKSLRIGNLRLFHVSQTREISGDEKAKTVEQQKAAIDRHTAKGKGKSATVHHLPQ